MFKHVVIISVLSCPLLFACSKGGAPAQEANEGQPAQDVESKETLPPPGDPGGLRQGLTREECEAQGGEVVGDIGDGATSQPGYLCPSGEPPVGDITVPADGPISVEGSVCCL